MLSTKANYKKKLVQSKWMAVLFNGYIIIYQRENFARNENMNRNKQKKVFGTILHWFQCSITGINVSFIEFIRWKVYSNNIAEISFFHVISSIQGCSMNHHNNSIWNIAIFCKSLSMRGESTHSIHTTNIVAREKKKVSLTDLKSIIICCFITW